LIATKTGLF